MTAHGSAAAEVVGVAATIGGADAWAAVGWVDVGCGVKATVESPGPQPLSSVVSSAAAASPVNPLMPRCRVHTTPHRTLTWPVDAAGVAERHRTTMPSAVVGGWWDHHR